jgi:hypothetical protein
MTRKVVGRFAQLALWFSPLVIVVAGFFATIYWLKPRNATFVLVLSAVASILVMGYAGFTTLRVQRRLDEVQIASQGFATFRGWVWGMGATVLLLMLPPVTNGLIDLADTLSTGSPDMSNRTSVQVALAFGFMLLVLVQTVCVIVASAIWQRRMGGREQS